MRMRKKKHGTERLQNCSEYLCSHAGTAFEKIKPLHLEIGCGKGRFILEKAKQNPEINFIAIEKISDVMLLAAESAKAQQLSNLKFINCNAQNLAQYFHESSVERIYLNFNDPWPNKGYYKRRLTYRDFLDIYKMLLVPSGEIHLKTDNEGYFDFSLEQLEQNGFTLQNVTRDLHHSIWDAENIRTEYETYFSSQGFPIFRCEAKFTSK